MVVLSLPLSQEALSQITKPTSPSTLQPPAAWLFVMAVTDNAARAELLRVQVVIRSVIRDGLELLAPYLL